jgi:16S rRNA (cytidine1402-2'-O)-methyltransferase
MTKLHEETLRGPLSEMAAHFERTPPRGEFTLVVEGAAPPAAVPPEDALALAERYWKEGMTASAAARTAAAETGVSKREIYRLLLKSDNKKDDSM